MIPASAGTDEPAVGDGDAVGVCAQVGEDVLGSTKRGLAVDIPFRVVEVGEECVEGGLWSQMRDLAWEGKLACIVSVFEEGQEFSPEESREHFDVDEEGVFGRDPLLAIGR